MNNYARDAHDCAIDSRLRRADDFDSVCCWDCETEFTSGHVGEAGKREGMKLVGDFALWTPQHVDVAVRRSKMFSAIVLNAHLCCTATRQWS